MELCQKSNITILNNTNKRWLCSCFWIAAPKFYPFFFLLVSSKDTFHLFFPLLHLTSAVPRLGHTFGLTFFLLTLDRNTERMSIRSFSHPWILKLLHRLCQAFKETLLKWDTILKRRRKEKSSHCFSFCRTSINERQPPSDNYFFEPQETELRLTTTASLTLYWEKLSETEN